MKGLSIRSKSAQSCLVSLIAINQLKRQFEDFQTEIFQQFSRIQKQSMEDIIALWKMVGMCNQAKRITSRERPSQELKSAFEMLNQKQQQLSILENKLIEAEESKQQLLNILQRQTELCSQIRNEQESQMINFNNKIQILEKIIEQRETSLNELSLETTVLKRLLREEYQSKQNTVDLRHYLTNSRRQLSEIQDSKKLFKHRNSQIGVELKLPKKGSYSKQIKTGKSSSSKLLKSLRPNDSSNSIKTQIQKIIQKAVKQNCQKYKR